MVVVVAVAVVDRCILPANIDRSATTRSTLSCRFSTLLDDGASTARLINRWSDGDGDFDDDESVIDACFDKRFDLDDE